MAAAFMSSGPFCGSRNVPVGTDKFRSQVISVICKELVDIEHASTTKSETQKHSITDAQSSVSFCVSWVGFREFGG